MYGFRYDTLEGHIERGIEWFVITRDGTRDIRFRIEARWKHGQLPNWWSRLGFRVLSGVYQRRWHRQAHRRLSLLAWYGSLAPPPRDAAGLTHQGVDVRFTCHSKRKARMNTTLLRDILALGALTGIRSMAGPATLIMGHGVLPTRAAAVLTGVEMMLDKTSFVGARTDAFPLAGRAVLGTIVGVVVAHERRGNRLLAGAIGAVAAIAAAHVATRVRGRLSSANVLAGVLEDLVVVGLGAAYVAGRPSRP